MFELIGVEFFIERIHVGGMQIGFCSGAGLDTQHTRCAQINEMFQAT